MFLTCSCQTHPDASRCVNMLTMHEVSLRSFAHLLHGSSQGWKLWCMVSIGSPPRLPLDEPLLRVCKIFESIYKVLLARSGKLYAIVCNWFAVVCRPSGCCLWHLRKCSWIFLDIGVNVDCSCDLATPCLWTPGSVTPVMMKQFCT